MRGACACISLARSFRLADQDGGRKGGEFVRSLQLSQCQLEPKKLAALQKLR